MDLIDEVLPVAVGIVVGLVASFLRPPRQSIGMLVVGSVLCGLFISYVTDEPVRDWVNPATGMLEVAMTALATAAVCFYAMQPRWS